jgi:hypothetical protein
MAATVGPLADVRRKSGRTSRTRSRKNRTAGTRARSVGGSAPASKCKRSGSTTYSRSPRTRSGARLVISTRTGATDVTRSATSPRTLGCPPRFNLMDGCSRTSPPRTRQPVRRHQKLMARRTVTLRSFRAASIASPAPVPIAPPMAAKRSVSGTQLAPPISWCALHRVAARPPNATAPITAPIIAPFLSESRDGTRGCVGALS